jgi:hypothetical protein
MELLMLLEIKILTGGKIKGQDIFFVPSLEQTQAGFSLGGTNRKDKLFFLSEL